MKCYYQDNALIKVHVGNAPAAWRWRYGDGSRNATTFCICEDCHRLCKKEDIRGEWTTERLVDEAPANKLCACSMTDIMRHGCRCGGK